MKTCFDAKIHFPIDVPCCESCHEDWEELIIEMACIGDYHVCCKVAVELIQYEEIIELTMEKSNDNSK